ncbi:uncharacterized protein PHALS_03938 [Plasmopara halstedii]|uniref:Uncharacterized protein n=1 Tax=Plasmopara halstedii TaxID=4781 RepID=A0A0P1A7T3_PLAHL|nr:uncharacterized protein PHALS_03938 [Plasmopara halstedii]CEG36730.1 hypothetical protein PHALS_03938 [Plasmopara halstedii]|eukprot:XP_024573099.1 hypothetical protein PHALS_03938 [Plasmopara halstedii]
MLFGNRSELLKLTTALNLHVIPDCDATSLNRIWEMVKAFDIECFDVKHELRTLSTTTRPKSLYDLTYGFACDINRTMRYAITNGRTDCSDFFLTRIMHVFVLYHALLYYTWPNAVFYDMVVS